MIMPAAAHSVPSANCSDASVHFFAMSGWQLQWPLSRIRTIHPHEATRRQRPGLEGGHPSPGGWCTTFQCGRRRSASRRAACTGGGAAARAARAALRDRLRACPRVLDTAVPLLQKEVVDVPMRRVPEQAPAEIPTAAAGDRPGSSCSS